MLKLPPADERNDRRMPHCMLPRMQEAADGYRLLRRSCWQVSCRAIFGGHRTAL